MVVVQDLGLRLCIGNREEPSIRFWNVYMQIWVIDIRTQVEDIQRPISKMTPLHPVRQDDKLFSCTSNRIQDRHFKNVAC